MIIRATEENKKANKYKNRSKNNIQARKERARRLLSLMLNAYGIEVDQGKCLERRGEMERVAYFYIIKSVSEQISRKNKYRLTY